MTKLGAAHRRIADFEEQSAGLRKELAVMARQLGTLTRYVFGKRSEQTPTLPAGGRMDLALETEQEIYRPRLSGR